MGEDEVLVPAIQLVNDQTIRQVQQDSFTYYHLLFDTHELIYAAGIASESFHPGEKAIGSMARMPATSCWRFSLSWRMSRLGLMAPVRAQPPSRSRPLFYAN